MSEVKHWRLDMVNKKWTFNVRHILGDESEYIETPTEFVLASEYDVLSHTLDRVRAERDALRTRIDRAMKVYHDWHTDPTVDGNGVLVKIATILEGGEDDSI